MSKDRMEKIRKFRARRPRGGGGPRMRGIFHQWKDGDNHIRLVGDFLEVRTHFISPNPKRKERGLCQATAFQGDDSIPKVINCPDWDIERSEVKATKTCRICKLNAIAHRVLQQEECTDEEKKYYENLRRIARQTIKLKWNILDRDDPFVLLVADGEEKRVKALKIADIGMEAWGDIEGIYDQMAPLDIADDKEGLDICVNRKQAQRMTYSAAAVLDTSLMPPTAKMTPLTDEEKAMKHHDLKAITGKQTDPLKVMDGLHDDYRQHLELDEEEEAEATGTTGTTGTTGATETATETATDEAKAAAAEVLDGDGPPKGDVEPDDDEDGLVPSSSPRRTPVSKKKG